MSSILHATSGALFLLLIPIIAILIGLAIIYEIIKTAVAVYGIMAAKKKIAERKENQGGFK